MVDTSCFIADYSINWSFLGSFVNQSRNRVRLPLVCVVLWYCRHFSVHRWLKSQELVDLFWHRFRWITRTHTVDTLGFWLHCNCCYLVLWGWLRAYLEFVPRQDGASVGGWETHADCRSSQPCPQLAARHATRSWSITGPRAMKHIKLSILNCLW